MINDDLTKALSDQMNAEFYSAYLYLVMSAYAESVSLRGAANWLHVQSREEMAHGVHMYQYILERGAAPSFGAIPQPPNDFASINDVFEKVLVHEQKITERINNIAALAMRENDHACYQFIMWYVNEQVEEESSVSNILGKLKMIGDDKGLLLSLDNEFAARTFAYPFPIKA